MDFASYKGGVMQYNVSQCKGIDHGVVAVGWGRDPTYGHYFIIRNSWGAQWGENGYIRIKYDPAALEKCSHIEYAVLPILN